MNIFPLGLDTGMGGPTAISNVPDLGGFETVIGNSFQERPQDPCDAYVYTTPGYVATRLGSYTDAVPADMNRSGHAVGTIWVPGRGEAADINSTGQVVGTFGYDATLTAAYWNTFPVIQQYDLTSLLPQLANGASWKRLTAATGINDQGFVVGVGSFRYDVLAKSDVVVDGGWILGPEIGGVVHDYQVRVADVIRILFGVVQDGGGAGMHVAGHGGPFPIGPLGWNIAAKPLEAIVRDIVNYVAAIALSDAATRKRLQRHALEGMRSGIDQLSLTERV